MNHLGLKPRSSESNIEDGERVTRTASEAGTACRAPTGRSAESGKRNTLRRRDAIVQTGISWRGTSSCEFARCVWINVTAPPPGGYAMTLRKPQSSTRIAEASRCTCEARRRTESAGAAEPKRRLMRSRVLLRLEGDAFVCSQRLGGVSNWQRVAIRNAGRATRGTVNRGPRLVDAESMFLSLL